MANTTDKSILTAAGKALLAQLNAEEKPLIIDKMMFANVPNRPEFPQPDDVVPTDDIVHQEQVEQRGRLSADSVIYSTTLTSDVGPFEFNWTGAYCSEYGVLVTIDHHSLTPKSADESGVAGNTLVRSVILEYKEIAEITNITVDASSWQYNATPRMKKMDDDVAQSIIDQNGKDWFIEDGFLVTPSSSAYNIKAGAGYVSGNRVTLEFDRNVQVPSKPSFIYVDAHREGTPTGEQVTLFDFVITAEEKDDYIDSSTGKDILHFVCKIAEVIADGSVSDLRPAREAATTAWALDKLVPKDMLQENLNDAQENKVMVNGAHGLGGDAIFVLGNDFNLDASDIPTGYYTVSTNHVGTYPFGENGTIPAILNVVRRYPGTNAFQTYISRNGNTFDRFFNGAEWSTWISRDSINGRRVTYGLVPGRKVNIYKWGSPYGGNDWCFVRTPSNYNPAGKPHPFVIMNHGNGWVMDGTEAKANFSDKTQFGVDTQNGGTYLDTNRTDYREFSSPLIEKFLAQGYVVCGAQNDGQNYGGGSAGYGNRETIQNIKSFYDHVKNNFNVEEQVNFIAASNGSIATINAAKIMGNNAIRSITLLYPLLNLHYAWSTTYSTQVAEAYRFTDNNNFTNFRQSTQGFDPFTADVDYGILPSNSDETAMAGGNYFKLRQDVSSNDVSWYRDDNLLGGSDAEVQIPLENLTFYRRCIFPFPRIRCHWSNDDTVTPGVAHWVPFKSLLTRGYSISTFEEVVTGQHGDYTHFEGLDGLGEDRIVNWTKV